MTLMAISKKLSRKLAAAWNGPNSMWSLNALTTNYISFAPSLHIIKLTTHTLTHTQSNTHYIKLLVSFLSLSRHCNILELISNWLSYRWPLTSRPISHWPTHKCQWQRYHVSRIFSFSLHRKEKKYKIPANDDVKQKNWHAVISHVRQFHIWRQFKYCSTSPSPPFLKNSNNISR